MKKTINDITAIPAAYAKFVPGKDGAFATCRLVQGADSAMDPQEWAELGAIDGEPAKVYYIFSEAEASSEDASDYPWDAEHVSKIEVTESPAVCTCGEAVGRSSTQPNQ
jgi:hypothetical protein